jgi:1-acyl-sn-glycerol-3-phosphate acyltransferase
MKNIVYKILMPIYGIFYRLIYRPTIIGKENIPKTGPIIMCGNHKHTRDQMNVMIVTRRVIHYMAKEEYFEGNFAWFFKLAGCIKVDRRIHDEEAKRIALDYLNKGEAIGIFPEGTRNKTIGTPEEVDLLPFKFGAVSFAKKTGALIVPFGISGEYTGKKGNLVCRIGKPIDIKGMDLESANELLRKNILKLMKKDK